MTRRETTRSALAITRIRLIGFHNFVDETIALSAAGGDVRTHLFLVGDNGSGKSTLLDAVHLVLTGADVELNAAARMGGASRSGPGRTLAGIVLRRRDEHVNDGHAIAYAALELSGETERWTIGVGLGATTLDARVTRWGFVRRGALESVALVREVEGEGGPVRRPCTSDELGAALGREAFARIGDYRARVAELLFGGETGYESACRLWSIAKAYREIAASTRDPSALVTAFLPPPRKDAIEATHTSLIHLDELEQSARALEDQRSRVAGIVACQSEVASLRREARALAARRARARARALAQRIAELDAQRAREAQALEAATAQVARTEDDERQRATMLAAAQAAGEGGGETGAWALARQAAQAALEARRAELERAETTRAQKLREEEDAARALARDEERAQRGEREARRALSAAVGDASRLPDLLPHTAALAAGAPEASAGRARGELDAALADAHAARSEALARLRDAARSVEEAERPPSRPASVAEDALEALRREGIEASSLARALALRPDASPASISALEAALPTDAWETLVTREEDVARARVIVGAHPGARLAVGERAESTCALPEWVEALLEPDGAGLAARARGTLARELAQPASGPLAPPDGLGGVVLRGVYVRAALHATRLGAAARARHESTLASGRAAALDGARAVHASASQAVASTSERAARVARAIEALGRLDSAELASLRAARDHAREKHALARAARAEADGAAGSAREALASAERAAAIEAPAGELALVERLETELAAARAARGAALDERARCAWACGEVDRRRAELAAQLREACGEPSESAEGDDESASEEELVQASERTRAEERARLEELLGDGSRGIRGPGAGPPFALAPDEGDTPRLVDAAGRAPAGVLSELDRTLEEVRRAVNEKTREVFDGIVVGSLAGQLQREVEQLHGTITGVNELLGRASYGGVRYAFRVTPRPDRAELVALVRRMSVLDPASRGELRKYVEDRRSDLAAAGDAPPALLDYRRWFDVRLVTRRHGAADSPWTRERAATGSGGEQGVPSHLVVLALARLALEGAGARAMPLLLDEAFHGIDATRREALLGFASELGLQLVIATPDQDGLVKGLRSTTTLFVVKDEHDDVHVVPYHYYDHASGAQASLPVG